MAKVLDNTRRSRLMLAGLVLAHLVVIGRQVDTGGGTSLLEHVLFMVLSPLQRGVSAVVHGVKGTWSAYVDLRGVYEENRHLREQLGSLQMQLQERQQQAREAERLRELLDLRRILPLETALAQVVARDGVPWFRTFTIDKGTSDGVALNAPVMSPTGVVGRVVAIGPHAARVQLLLDRDSGVGVQIERTRVTGVVTGQVAFSHMGTTDLVMKYVSALADVAVGDVVVTSGMDRIYPKGLVVGRVRTVGTGSGLFKEILVTPSARFDQIEEVLVVKGPREAPKFTAAVR